MDQESVVITSYNNKKTVHLSSNETWNVTIKSLELAVMNMKLMDYGDDNSNLFISAIEGIEKILDFGNNYHGALNFKKKSPPPLPVKDNNINCNNTTTIGIIQEKNQNQGGDTGDDDNLFLDPIAFSSRRKVLADITYAADQQSTQRFISKNSSSPRLSNNSNKENKENIPILQHKEQLYQKEREGLNEKTASKRKLLATIKTII